MIFTSNIEKVVLLRSLLDIYELKVFPYKIHLLRAIHLVRCQLILATVATYRGTSLIRNAHPPRNTIEP